MADNGSIRETCEPRGGPVQCATFFRIEISDARKRGGTCRSRSRRKPGSSGCTARPTRPNDARRLAVLSPTFADVASEWVEADQTPPLVQIAATAGQVRGAFLASPVATVPAHPAS
jgi:hypothetical protein